jgi:hypothetical protein
MSTQLYFPTLPAPAVGWLAQVPHWRVQSWRVSCGHSIVSIRPRLSQNYLVEWHFTRASALQALAWHDAVGTWKSRVLSAVLIPEEAMIL